MTGAREDDLPELEAFSLGISASLTDQGAGDDGQTLWSGTSEGRQIVSSLSSQSDDAILPVSSGMGETNQRTSARVPVQQEGKLMSIAASRRPSNYASLKLSPLRLANSTPIMKSPVVKRSIVIAEHRTSVSVEDAFWKGLKEIARGRDLTLSEMVAMIKSGHAHRNLSSAIRLFVLDHYRSLMGAVAARIAARQHREAIPGRHELPHET